MSLQSKRILRTPGAAKSEELHAKPHVLSSEIGLVFTGLILLLWLISLLSHTNSDPAWSTSGTQQSVSNWAGVLGAYVSDLSFYVLGYSAWWLILVGSYAWGRCIFSYLSGDGDSRRRVLAAATDEPHRHRKNRKIKMVIGLVLLLGASSSLEWAHLYYLEHYMPGTSGGVVGLIVGEAGERLLGNLGSVLVGIICLLLGSAWSFGFLWSSVAEKLGAWICHVWLSQAKRREEVNDRTVGSKAAKEREQEQAKQHDALVNEIIKPKVVIATPVVETAPVSAPPLRKEAQRPLFPDATDSKLPQISLLDRPPVQKELVSAETLEMTSRLIEVKLKDFGVEANVMVAQPGPVITRYEIEPATGVKGAQVVALAKDLARALSLASIRVVENIPGKAYMALELPNPKRQAIGLSEILDSGEYAASRSLLTLGLGKDIVGTPVVADLAKMPHLLVAGTTGSGKSVGVNAMILSLLYKAEPSDVRLLLIDPKMLELSVYEGIPHLLAPVVTDMKQAAHGLNWCVAEMERRYKIMSKMGVRNLASYNIKIEEATLKGQPIPNPFSLIPEEPEPLTRMPFIVVVIDELADLMMVVGKKIEELIARLAQKARACGIHLILATQRPSVDVITGLIKANIPTRISFKVSSKIDSRTILDEMGADSLLGLGDMLYKPGTGVVTRVHGAFVSDEEVHRVVEFLKSFGEPEYIEGLLEGGVVDGSEGSGEFGLSGDTGGEKDPFYDQAVEIVLKNRKASISLVQRHLKIGYNRAARLVEDMEKAGLVSSMNTQGQREILVPTRQD